MVESKSTSSPDVVLDTYKMRLTLIRSEKKGNCPQKWVKVHGQSQQLDFAHQPRAPPAPFGGGGQKHLANELRSAVGPAPGQPCHCSLPSPIRVRRFCNLGHYFCAVGV